MSARHVFIPRPLSCMPSSEPQSHPADVRSKDGDKDTFVNRTGKARSVAAFLGQKRGGTDTASQGVGPTQGASLGRSNTSSNRRSFEGVLRPEMTPMSIIPYPATTQLGSGTRQPSAGQTPRKRANPGVFEFPRPMTPVSVSRGLKKGFGIFASDGEDEPTSNRSEHENNVLFMGPEGEADVRLGAGAGIGGYMRTFEGSGGGGSAGGLQPSLERDIAAPVPGYALGRPGTDPENEGCEIESMLVPSSKSLGAMADEETGVEKNHGSERSIGQTKRRMRRENVEDSGRYSDEGNEPRGSTKRMRQMQYDPNEYFPISSPHIPPTPGPPTSTVGVLDPSLVVGSLVENMEEFVNLEEIEADWKRWKGCATEEWLKGADELVQDYTDILNMVKDHLTEKVLAYARMISSVEERRTEVNGNIEIIHGKGNIIRENISKLGTKK